MSALEHYVHLRGEVLSALQQVAAHRDTISYSEFGRMVNPPLHHRNPMLYELLRDVCEEERRAGRPNLCALVVRKSDGIPGKGFFEGSAIQGVDMSDYVAYWQAQVEACWKYYAVGMPPVASVSEEYNP